MCFGDLSNPNVHHKKTTELSGNFYDFSVDYSAISNDKIHDVHAYLMRKNGIK